MKAFKLMIDLFDYKSIITFMMWQLITTILGTGTKYIYSLIIKSDNLSQNLILLMIIAQIIELSVSPKIKKQTDEIVKDICNLYKEKELIDFNDNISAESKEKLDITRFEDNVDRMCHTVEEITNWFVPHVVSVIILMSLVFFTFESNEYWIILLIVICQSIAYKYFYEPKKHKLGEIESECCKERERARNHKTFVLGTFEMNLHNWSVIRNDDILIHNSRKKYFEKVQEANSIISYTNIASMIIVVFFVTTNLKAVIICMSSLTNAIDNMMECISWMTRADSNIDEFYEKKNKLIRQMKPTQKVLPNKFTITRVNIPRGSRFINYKEIISINRTDRVLIRGSSGSGKSTFLKGLLGHLGGVEINGYSSQYFMDNFITVTQGGHVKFDKLSISDLFDSNDEFEIEKFCRMALLDNWIEKTKQSKIMKRCDIEMGFMDINPLSWLDTLIEVSGGEHKRLTIAYKLFLVNKHRNRFKVITLDEPEQGSDLYDQNRNDGYEMLRRINEGFPDKALIVVSHMYNLNGDPHVKEVKGRSIKWSKILSFN